MRARRRPLALIALIALAACGSSTDVHTSRADPIGSALTTPSSAPVDSTAPPTGVVEWAPCNDPSAEVPTLECATLKVPLDYDQPSGEAIDLALIRLPATGDREGAVLFNP